MRPLRRVFAGLVLLAMSLPCELFLNAYAWAWHDERVARGVVAMIPGLFRDPGHPGVVTRVDSLSSG
jgi:hypothetical protein